MDLYAAREAIDELLRIDGAIEQLESFDQIALSMAQDRTVSNGEWLEILRARRTKAEARLREVGVVAAHTPLCRTFRDAPGRQAVMDQPGQDALYPPRRAYARDLLPIASGTAEEARALFDEPDPCAEARVRHE